jgi:hypothetical protein
MSVAVGAGRDALGRGPARHTGRSDVTARLGLTSRGHPGGRIGHRKGRYNKQGQLQGVLEGRRCPGACVERPESSYTRSLLAWGDCSFSLSEAAGPVFPFFSQAVAKTRPPRRRPLVFPEVKQQPLDIQRITQVRQRTCVRRKLTSPQKEEQKEQGTSWQRLVVEGV